MEIPIALQAWILKENFFYVFQTRESIQNWAHLQLKLTTEPSEEILELVSDEEFSKDRWEPLLDSFIDSSVLSRESTEILFGLIGKRFFDTKSNYNDCICCLFQMTEFVYEFEMEENFKDKIMDMYEIVDLIHVHNLRKNIETRRQMELSLSDFSRRLMAEEDAKFDELKEIETAENMLSNSPEIKSVFPECEYYGIVPSGLDRWREEPWTVILKNWNGRCLGCTIL